jgi:hypothetical protein
LYISDNGSGLKTFSLGIDGGVNSVALASATFSADRLGFYVSADASGLLSAAVLNSWEVV